MFFEIIKENKFISTFSNLKIINSEQCFSPNTLIPTNTVIIRKKSRLILTVKKIGVIDMILYNWRSVAI